MKGVSKVCQKVCGKACDKQLPGIVGIRESHHTCFNMKVTFGG